MNLFKELQNAHYLDKRELVWNDPDPIKGNDYTITFIETIDDSFDKNTPILIQYNEGNSEAQVFLHEIKFK